VRLDPGADVAVVTRRLAEAGFRGRSAGGATSTNRDFLAVLAAVLRIVAIAIGLVCAAAIAQALALTARDRRRALAVLRATGASRAALATVLAGAAGALMVPAFVLAVALERLVLGPVVAGLAADYASLRLTSGVAATLAVAAGLALAGAIAVLAVARSATREPVTAGLGRAD